jgi:fermentation-respiration switch protein FrsA (DUF1100 family)
MAGNLHLPENFDKANKYAAIVCVHPGSGVKEQTVGASVHTEMVLICITKLHQPTKKCTL